MRSLLFRVHHQEHAHSGSGRNVEYFDRCWIRRGNVDDGPHEKLHFFSAVNFQIPNVRRLHSETIRHM